MSAALYVVCHLSEDYGLDVLLRTPREAVSRLETRCSGPSAHAIRFGALVDTHAEMPAETRTCIERALRDGSHPALHPPVADEAQVEPAEPAPAPPVAPPACETKPAEPPPVPAPVAAPVPPPAPPVEAPAPRAPEALASEPRCAKCDRAPPAVHNGTLGLWCAPCRARVIQAMKTPRR